MSGDDGQGERHRTGPRPLPERLRGSGSRARFFLPLSVVLVGIAAVGILHRGWRGRQDEHGTAAVQSAAEQVCEKLGLRCTVVVRATGTPEGKVGGYRLTLAYVPDSDDPAEEAGHVAREIKIALPEELQGRHLLIRAMPQGARRVGYGWLCRQTCEPVKERSIKVR